MDQRVNYLRNHIISRIICIAFALHIFNMSIDPPDAKPHNIPEDLSINEIESILEFALENVMGIKNAIPEHDEPDEDKSTVDSQKIDCYPQQRTFRPIERTDIIAPTIFSNYKDRFYLSQYINVLIRPPEVKFS